jgi:hypothetical protein
LVLSWHDGLQAKVLDAKATLVYVSVFRFEAKILRTNVAKICENLAKRSHNFGMMLKESLPKIMQ